MAYLIAGIVILCATGGSLWFSLPGGDGQMRAHLAHGADIWMALAISGGTALGIGALIVGTTTLLN